jgi:plasmid stabilization system protein ParE
MAKLIIVASARRDLSDIFDYISRDKPIAAANWVDKIEEKCKLIETSVHSRAAQREAHPTPPLSEAESVDDHLMVLLRSMLELHRRRPRSGSADVPCWVAPI